MIQKLLSRIDSDNRTKEIYLQCYYIVVENVYRQAQKLKDKAPDQYAKGVTKAATLAVDLARKQAGFVNDATRSRFRDLMDAEPELKDAFVKADLAALESAAKQAEAVKDKSAHDKAVSDVASMVVDLEKMWPDYGGEDAKGRVTTLLGNAELKAAYDQQKGSVAAVKWIVARSALSKGGSRLALAWRCGLAGSIFEAITSMKRILFALFVSFFAVASSPAQDVVVRRDPKGGKDVSVNGTIEQESPAGVKIKVGKESQLIPADDIVHIAYRLPTVSEIEFGTPYGKEQQAMTKTGPARKAELADVLKSYQDLEKRVKGTPNALRYIQYRDAMLAVDRAKDDPAVDAVAALTKFRQANSGGWEITPATKALAGLLEAKGDQAGARAAYEELAANPDASESVQLAANLQVARLLSRDGKNADAEQKLKAVMAGMKADDPQRTYVQVSLAQTQVAQGNVKDAEAPLKAAVASAGDDHLKSLAYNALGDYYLKTKQPDEAFWQYLRVDAVYNQDREEHARALYNLWMLFESARGDQTRSNESLQKLEDKSLAGTDYQARALKEAGETKKAP